MLSSLVKIGEFFSFNLISFAKFSFNEIFFIEAVC